MTWDKKHIDIKLINFGKTFGDVLGTCAVSYHHLICTISMFLYLFFFQVQHVQVEKDQSIKILNLIMMKYNL